MASNRTTTIVIAGDASGVKKAAKVAEGSIDKLSSSVDSQSKNLDQYGEKLGKAFGPGQGLKGKLGDLETPLRDTEGAIARSQMAFTEFGKAGATASDKVGAGFLLLSDGIAAFGSGGVAGIAIAAGVAGISLLAATIYEQEQASKAAAEETAKQAEALQGLAKSASDANITILLLNAQESEKGLRAKVRAADHERRILKGKLELEFETFNKLTRKHNKMMSGLAKTRLGKKIDEERARLDVTEEAFDKANKIAGDAEVTLKAARDKVLKEEDNNSRNAITMLTKRLDEKAKVVEKSIAKAARKAARASGSDNGTAEAEKIANERLKEIEADRRLDLKVAADNKAFDRSEAADAAAFDAEMLAAKKLGEEEFLAWKRSADKKAADDAIERGRKAQESFMKVNAVQIAATRAIIGGLQQMAHDGEISFAALGDAAMTAAGNQLVASGTEHLLGGAAKAFAGAATFNPVMVAGGTAEAGQGALMIAAGLGLGAVGGAIGRSGAAPAAPSGSSAPTDSRESRAASGGSGGEGGSTIINFNGPAYDRRGVANVLTSGNRMARHRRIAGA